MRARLGHITCTMDFGRPYRCIVDEHGHYVMEDYLHFTESFSVLVLQDCPVRGPLLNATLSKMWGLLRYISTQPSLCRYVGALL
jgi:hypothetical protein